MSHLKLYEYFGSMKTILAVGSKVDVLNQNLKQKTNIGFIAIRVDNICNILVKLYNQHINKKVIAYRPKKKEIKKHSYYERGKNFRELLISL